MRAVVRTGAGIDFVGQFGRAAERVASEVAALDLTLPVPSCPGWSAYDVVVHLGNVHGRVATIVETRREAPHQHDAPPSRRPSEVASWYAAKAEDLYQVLRGTPPDESCWNFAFGTGPVAFWQRRQLHETLMHHVDLALAAQRPLVLSRDLPPELAADGVDEVLRVWLHRMHGRGEHVDLVAPLTLVAVDVPRAWGLLPVPPDEVPTQRSAPGRPPGAVAGQGAGAGQQAGAGGHTTGASEQAVAGQQAGAGPSWAEPRVVDGVVPGADRLEGSADALLRLLWKRLPTVRRFVRYVGDQHRIERFLDSHLTS